MRKHTWVVTAAFTAGCVLGVIGVLPAGGEVVTLSRVYALALEQNEEALIAREGVRSAEQEKRRARSQELPTVTASGWPSSSASPSTGCGC